MKILTFKSNPNNKALIKEKTDILTIFKYPFCVQTVSNQAFLSDRTQLFLFLPILQAPIFIKYYIKLTLSVIGQYNHKFHSKDMVIVIILWYSFWIYSDIIVTSCIWSTSGWTAFSFFPLRSLVDLRIMNFRKINFIVIIVDFLFPVVLTKRKAYCMLSNPSNTT